jgi:uncharacterized OsmC-like protein
VTSTTQLNDLDLNAVTDLIEAVRTDPSKADSVWRADVRWQGGLRSQAAIREFPLIGSDEPAGLGGTDTAPNPVEQVAAALGHCLAVGYVAALSARAIAIRSIDIAVEGHLDLRPFLGLAPGHAGYTSVNVAASIDADADAPTLRAIHEQVVAASPVGTTLTNPVQLDVRLVLAGEKPTA